MNIPLCAIVHSLSKARTFNLDKRHVREIRRQRSWTAFLLFLCLHTNEENHRSTRTKGSL